LLFFLIWIEMFRYNVANLTNFEIVCTFYWKLVLKLDHPVTQLFSNVQGGSTTQINRLELLFSVEQSKKMYLKNCVQGEQK